MRQRKNKKPFNNLSLDLRLTYNLGLRPIALIFLRSGMTPLEVVEKIEREDGCTREKAVSCLPKRCLLPDGSLPEDRNPPGTRFVVLAPCESEVLAWGGTMP
jgi:hypothetical protein